ncbi:MAG: hypothetical protein WAM28_06040 [Chlamydiales bacterium]
MSSIPAIQASTNIDEISVANSSSQVNGTPVSSPISEKCGEEEISKLKSVIDNILKENN